MQKGVFFSSKIYGKTEYKLYLRNKLKYR